MNLTEIHWPVYKLGTEKPLEEDGVLFFIRNGKETASIEILDDKTLPASSLAGRRLKLFSQGTKLFKLKLALFFLGDLIKIATKSMWFIDSSGNIFQYTKSKLVPLVFKRITNVVPSVGCSLIEVEDIMTRFKTLFSPLAEQKYAGLLKLDRGYILYGLYDTIHENTIRKI